MTKEPLPKRFAPEQLLNAIVLIGAAVQFLANLFTTKSTFVLLLSFIVLLFAAYMILDKSQQEQKQK